MIALALVAVLALSGCHHVTAKVDCSRDIRLEGRGFARADFPLSLDGPGEYELVLRQRPARNWHERVPLGGPGFYTLMWGSGFSQFFVECGL